MGIRYKIKYEYRFAHHAAHFSRDVKPFAPIFGLCANNIDFLSSSSSTQSAARLTVQGNVCPDVDQVLFGARGSSDTHSVTPGETRRRASAFISSIDLERPGPLSTPS